MSTKKPKPLIVLGEREFVVNAKAQTCSGPGWTNPIIWVEIENGADGKRRTEGIRREHMTSEMCSIFAVCEAAHKTLMSAVKSVTGKRGGK